MPRSRMTESDQNILRQMQYHNQDCMANMGRSMQLIEHFKTIRQPVIDSFDHQVITDKENVPTKTSQLTDQKSQWTVYQQQRSEVESTRRSDIYQSNAGWFSRKPRITVKAQLFCRRKDGLASTVASQMSTMLRTRFNVDNVDLVMETVDQGSSIRPGVPVMVICINTSWLDTDVASALQNLTVNKSMALVVMHHTDIDALPNQSSDRVLCRELTAADYKQLCSIFNMAFLSSKGIYPCDMNKRTVSAIVDFIRQHN